MKHNLVHQASCSEMVISLVDVNFHVLYFMGVSAPMTMSRSSEGELNLVGRFRSRTESRDQKTLPRNVIVACF